MFGEHITYTPRTAPPILVFKFNRFPIIGGVFAPGPFIEFLVTPAVTRKFDRLIVLFESGDWATENARILREVLGELAGKILLIHADFFRRRAGFLDDEQVFGELPTTQSMTREQLAERLTVGNLA